MRVHTRIDNAAPICLLIILNVRLYSHLENILFDNNLDKFYNSINNSFQSDLVILELVLIVYFYWFYIFICIFRRPKHYKFKRLNNLNKPQKIG